MYYLSVAEAKKPAGISALNGGIGPFLPDTQHFDTEERTVYEIGGIYHDQLKQPAKAVAAWDRYRTRYPNGLLRAEADLSVIDTLVSLGEQKRTLGESLAFLKRYPHSERRGEIARVVGDIYRGDGNCGAAMDFYRVAQGAKVNHFSYIGDARVGEKANVGAGTIVCNYDGFAKRQTIIGEGAFIGSDSQLVAPVTIGKNAYVGTGSTINEDVPEDALAIGRARQVTKPGYAKKLREKLAAAKKSR